MELFLFYFLRSYATVCRIEYDIRADQGVKEGDRGGEDSAIRKNIYKLPF
jgi:hypothetical protein